MYATDRQTSDAYHRLMSPPYGGGGNITMRKMRMRSAVTVQTLIVWNT